MYKECDGLIRIVSAMPELLIVFMKVNIKYIVWL